MPNDLRLQEGHPVDENLRPIKVGGEVTALEVSKKDVRVNNLYVNGTTTGVSASDATKLPLTGGAMTGAITTNSTFDGVDVDACNTVANAALPKAGGTMTGDITTDSNIVSTDLTINDAGSISLDATSTDSGTGLLLKNAGTLIGDITAHHSKTYLTLYENGGASTTDYFEINVAANGATTLSTIDGGVGTDASLILDTDGSIALDSHTGNFIAKKADTEFSVHNSAYAGMILGYTTVGIDAAADSYTLTTSFVTVDDALKVKFVAPPSGVVEISVSIYCSFSRRSVQFGLSDQDTGDTYQAISFPNATDVTNEHYVASPPSALGDRDINHSWVVTGLAAGDPYEWWLGAKSVFTGGVLRWGSNASNGYGPFIMIGTALPRAVTGFAVYG